VIVTNQLLLSLLLASMASPALPQAKANKDGVLSVEEQQRGA